MEPEALCYGIRNIGSGGSGRNEPALLGKPVIALTRFKGQAGKVVVPRHNCLKSRLVNV